MHDLDLAALLVSRVCHDLISPVGAISNGIEILEDETDADMRGHAMKLIEHSVGQAKARLLFARLAFGAMGSAGAEIPLREAGQVATEFFAGGKAKFQWSAPDRALDKEIVKVLMNMAAIGADCIPRGGQLSAEAKPHADGHVELHVSAEGPRASLAPDILGALKGETAFAELTGRTIAPYITGLLARKLGAGVQAAIAAERVTLSATLTKKL